MSLYAEDCASKADGMANESTYFSEMQIRPNTVCLPEREKSLVNNLLTVRVFTLGQEAGKKRITVGRTLLAK
jgi:hypothetical protein